MTPEVDKYFQNYFELFATPGWKQLVEDVTEGLEGESLQIQVSVAITERELGVLQGQLQQAKRIAILPAQLAAAYEQHKEDAADEQDLA